MNFFDNKTQYDWLPGKSQNSKLKRTRDLRRLEAENSQKGQNLIKNGQILNIFEYPRHAEYDFSKKTIRTTSIPKIRMIHSGVWKIKLKTYKRPEIWSKMAKFEHLKIFQACII